MLQADLPALIRSELPVHAWRIISLRYLSAIGIVLGAMMLVQSMGASLDPAPLYVIAAALVLTNLLYSLHLWRAAQYGATASPEAAARSVLLQLAADLFLLTLLVHFSGGVSNPLMVLYILPVLLSGFLLSVRATYVVAVLAAIFYGGMVILEYRGVIPHVPVPGLFPPLAYRSAPYLVVVLIAFGLAVGLTAIVSCVVSGRLNMVASAPETTPAGELEELGK